METREDSREEGAPFSSTLVVPGAMGREERLGAGVGAQLPPPACFLKVPLHRNIQLADGVPWGGITPTLLPIAGSRPRLPAFLYAAQSWMNRSHREVLAGYKGNAA